MPGKVQISVLLFHLEILKDNLSALWIDCKNFDHLAQIEEMVNHLQKIIESLNNA